MLDKAELTNKILERLQQFEKDRITRLSKLVVREFFVFAVLFILIKCFLICSYDFDAAFWFGVMICGVIYYSFYDITHTDKLFKNFIKSKCKNVIKNSFVNNNATISSGDISSSNLFGYFEDVNIDDGFLGTYNSVDYRILETLLTAKSPKGFDIKIFKGLIVLFEFNKKILKDTIITRKNDTNIRQNLYGENIKRFLVPFVSIMLFIAGAVALTSIHSFDIKEILDILGFLCITFIPGILFVMAIIVVPWWIMHVIQRRKNPMADTKMEDIVFNKDYIVHTKDKVEARYLITTAFIERYLKLQKIFKTKNIKCSFFKEQLMIAIPTRKDFFELGSIFLPLSNTTYINKFYDDITEILKIIDVLKLNERTGL